MKLTELKETHQSGAHGGGMDLTVGSKGADSEAGLISKDAFIGQVLGELRKQDWWLKDRNDNTVRKIAARYYDNSQSVQSAVNAVLQKIGII